MENLDPESLFENYEIGITYRIVTNVIGAIKIIFIEWDIKNDVIIIEFDKNDILKTTTMYSNDPKTGRPVFGYFHLCPVDKTSGYRVITR